MKEKLPVDFTDRELMVIAAAREIRDDDVVFVGMRLPLIAFAYAKRTHAPGATGLFENGIVRDQPAPETLMTMSDTPNIPGALWCTGTLEIMAFLQQGLVDLGFIGGAEIDRFGNLNTSYIGDWRRPKVRLPGSGGGADIASLARRFVVIMPQEKHRFRERVDYITSPGFGDGPGWRARVGLTGGGPAAVVTTLGVFRFDPATCEMYLASYHPGQSVDRVRAATGFALADRARRGTDADARPPRSSPSSASATRPASGPAARDHGRTGRSGGPTVAHVGHPGPHLPHRVPAPRGARRDRQGAHAGLRHHRHRGGPALRDVLLLVRGLHGPGRRADRQRRPALGDRGRRGGDGRWARSRWGSPRAPPCCSPAACWWAWARP